MAGISSCAAGVITYVRVVLEGCSLVDKWAWVAIPVLIAFATFLFRWLHSFVGGDTDLLGSRTTFLVSLMVLFSLSAWFILPNMTGAIDRGRQKRTMADMRTVGMALADYRDSHGVYPQMNDPRELQQELTGYLRALPTHDGWHNPFVFHMSSTSYTLVSWGKCGQPDIPSSLECPPGTTADFRADIVYSDGKFARWPQGIQAN